MADIDEIIGKGEAAPAQPSEETHEEATADEASRKEEQLKNVRKAVAEANEELRRLRAEAREVKKAAPQGEEQLPAIDLKDPSAAAWDKHMTDKVSPLREELEQEKREIRAYALQQFLNGKPALSADAEKVKELIAMYEKLRTATERTSEGVLMDLNRAYAALNADTLIAAARGQRVASVQAEAALSDIAVSRGASSYQSPKKNAPVLSEDDKRQLARWGMTPEEWVAEKEKYI